MTISITLKIEISISLIARLISIIVFKLNISAFTCKPSFYHPYCKVFISFQISLAQISFCSVILGFIILCCKGHFCKISQFILSAFND